MYELRYTTELVEYCQQLSCRLYYVQKEIYSFFEEHIEKG
jgi:hypothetical protein